MSTLKGYIRVELAKECPTLPKGKTVEDAINLIAEGAVVAGWSAGMATRFTNRFEYKYKSPRAYIWFLHHRGVKYCSECKTIKSRDEFHAKLAAGDNLRSTCKYCKKNYYEANKEANKERIAEYNKAYREANKEDIAVKTKAYREANKENIAAAHKAWYAANKEDILVKTKAYREVNKEDILVKAKAYYEANKPAYFARAARRRATKLNATPLWCETELIKEFYANRPEGYHVDHIVPLQHPLVCGLHCIDNLQYLTAEENLSKSNKFEVA